MIQFEKQILSVSFLLEEALRASEAGDVGCGWMRIREAQQALGCLIKSPEVIVTVHADLASALTNMGFKRVEARRAASAVIERLGKDSGLEPMILAAIQELAGKTRGA